MATRRPGEIVHNFVWWFTTIAAINLVSVLVFLAGWAIVTVIKGGL